MTLLSLALCAHAAPVKIAEVSAKSYYSKNGASYFPDGVKDSKSTPPWFEGDPGNGVGAWIEVDLGGEHRVTQIKVFAGDWTSGGDWQRANRPAEVEIKWSDDSTDMWNMADEWLVQSFTPSSPKTTSKIRFKINSLHNGTAFPDTAISEIQVFDDQPGTVAVVKSVAASSEFPSDNDGSYFAFQASDGIRDTMWCEGDKASDGVGSWVEFDLGAATRISSLMICSGMCASKDIHDKGNHPSRVTLTFDDGSTQSAPLKDFFLPQKVALTSPKTTGKVKLTIDEIRKGTAFDDACISEVTFNR